jgi:hypothetical protein
MIAGATIAPRKGLDKLPLVREAPNAHLSIPLPIVTKVGG